MNGESDGARPIPPGRRKGRKSGAAVPEADLGAASAARAASTARAARAASTARAARAASAARAARAPRVPAVPPGVRPLPRVTHRTLVMRGLDPAQAANLTAYLNGLPVSGHRWTLPEVNRLLFLRAVAQREDFGH